MSVVHNKVVVVGRGRFGNATAQGLREGFVEGDDGKRAKCDVVQLSATKFTSLSVSDMADELQDIAFVAYCGTQLPEHARRIAAAIHLATSRSSNPALEFIDFSNPDPGSEKKDVSGALDLWVALNTDGGKDEEATKTSGSVIKVWKITEVGSVDVSGITSNTGKSLVHWAECNIPNIMLMIFDLYFQMVSSTARTPTGSPRSSSPTFPSLSRRSLVRISLKNLATGLWSALVLIVGERNVDSNTLNSSVCYYASNPEH